MRLVAVLVCSLCLPVVAAPAKDKPGCQDSPLVTRLPGSILTRCQHSPFEAVKMYTSGPDRVVEGEHDKIFYSSDGHSMEEVRRNFANAFQAAGYTVEYNKNRNVVVHKGNVWIRVETEGSWYSVETVREQEMQQQVVANADQLKKGLDAEGHMVANGILFDTDKAELKPESKAALDEIAKLMKDNAALKVYVVGHTDNQGALAHNMELSKARAASVVKALETQYGIPASRLASYGDGPYAPAASNDREDGRAKNRRVELVKQ